VKRRTNLTRKGLGTPKKRVVGKQDGKGARKTPCDGEDELDRGKERRRISKGEGSVPRDETQEKSLGKGLLTSS